jgi:alkaline phosphatase D
MMTRKEFLLTIPAAALVPSAFAVDPAPTTPAPKKTPAPPLTLPPVQPGPAYFVAGPQLGHVAHDEARVWVRATAAASWKILLGKADAPEQTRAIEGPALTEDTGLTGIAIIGGLEPATRYVYQVLLDGREQLARPLPSFLTAPAPNPSGRLRVAFGSCIGGTLAAAAPSWAELAARRESKPDAGGFDVLLMLGDNHYANTTDLEKHRVYYTAHRLSAGWRDLSARTPIYAIWDDHDFGPNNSDGTSPGKADSLRAFREYWANPACGEPDNPGCYFTFTRGPVQFFMVDGRYHRSPNTMPDGPEKTMLGAKQLAWLKRELRTSRSAVKLVAMGSEWESHGSEDSWARFRHERDLFLKWIDDEKIEGVIFLSGDRHFSSCYHINGRFLEMSGGPFGSDNSRLRPNPERFAGYDQGRLWCILDIDTTGATPAVAGEIWQAGRGRLERRDFTWAQLHGRAPIERSPAYTV